MAERLLKTKKQKIPPAKPMVDEPKKIVLVGTYAGSQLADWPGFYPYPISADDKIDAGACAKVNEIWLFKGTKEPKYFAAEFVGVKNREELKALGYPAKGKGHGDGVYLLFKIEKTYAPASSSAALAASVERVIVRTKDFARTPKVRKQLKGYLESTNRADRDLAALLPSIITQLPAESLRVCEAAAFPRPWSPIKSEETETYAKIGDIVMCAIEFAKRHRIRPDQAFKCLLRYKAVDYIDKCWRETTCSSIGNLVDDVSAVCRNNGWKGSV